MKKKSRSGEEEFRAVLAASMGGEIDSQYEKRRDKEKCLEKAIIITTIGLYRDIAEMTKFLKSLYRDRKGWIERDLSILQENSERRS